ncbi:LysM peptidoglycan-binding domain-containing protein [Streptomyces chartreusis]
MVTPQRSPAPTLDRDKPSERRTGRAYTVQSGDTLSGLAVRFGVRGGWLALYQVNRSVIGTNPHLIYPGQTLAL